MIQIIGWAILHSLWQIALITLLYAVIKSLWKGASARQQYALSLTALVASLLAPILTIAYLWPTQNNAIITTKVAVSTNDMVTIPTTVGTTEEVVFTTFNFADYLTMALPYLVAFWVLGMSYFLLRFILNLTNIQKLQNAENEIITGEWLAKISAFQQQLNIEKKVQVFLSKHVKEPITFGHFKPIILLPISLMTGFDAAAIETILLHELAHIKRHDYLVNLGQSIIEIILFYHPCIWWLSKEIRTIREHCCDDLVLSMGDNRAAYVRTLTTLQWRKIGAVSNRLSMAASGEDNDFTRRIKRMFGVEEKRGFSFRQLMGVFLVLLILAVGGVGYQTYFQPTQLEQLEPIKNFAGIKQISDIEFRLQISDQTTKPELERWIHLAKSQGAEIDFLNSTFDKNDKLVELHGHARSSGNDWTFYAADLPCTNLVFNLHEDQLLGPFYSYPCQKDTAAVTFILIDGNSFGEHYKETLDRLAQLGIFHGFSMSKDENFFNGSYIKTDGTWDYIEVEDVAKTPIKITIENQLIKSIEIIKSANKSLSSWTIKNDITPRQLLEFSKIFGEDSNTKVTFNDFNVDEDGHLTGKIRGTIRPNKSGRFHFFEVHNLDKYSILLQANADTILAPKYILNESEKVISKVDNQSTKQSKIKINHQTTRTDLENWANTVTQYGIIFNYENSVFDDNDRLLGLNGKFNGQCCFNDAFFVSQLDKVEVHLKVKDNYIHQPTIITTTNDSYEELKEKFWKDAVELGGLSSANYDDLWMGGAMRKMKIISDGEDKSFKREFYFDQMYDPTLSEQRRDTLMSILRKKNRTPSSYVPLLQEKEDFQKYIDSIAPSSVGENSNKLETDNHAILIPTDQTIIKAIDQQNLLYQGKAPQAIYAAGKLTPEQELPAFLKNQQDLAISVHIPITKRFPKTSSNKNWIYWGDQKIEFTATFREGLNGKIRMATPKFTFTKAEWDYLKNQPFTFFLDGQWYKVKTIEEIVLVPKSADPVSANLHEGYEQILQNPLHRAMQLVSQATVGDQIYYEKIDVGKDFVFGMVVEITANAFTNTTITDSTKSIDFENAELTLPDSNLNASHTVFSNWRNLTNWSKQNQPDTQIKLRSSDGTEAFVVDGILWRSEQNYKLDPETIESIDIISGTKAQLLYGVPKAVLITTKKKAVDTKK